MPAITNFYCVPSSKRDVTLKVLENDFAKIQGDFQIQADIHAVAIQPGIVVISKGQKRVVVVGMAIPSDGNIKRKIRNFRNSRFSQISWTGCGA